MTKIEGKVTIQNQNNTCPACSSERVTYWFTKITNQQKYPICRCSDCKGAFVLPRPSNSQITTFYQDEYYRKSDTLNASEQLAKLLKSEAEYPNSMLDAARMIGQAKDLANGKKFLDVGGGYGFFSQAALSAGFDVTAIEPSPTCRKVFTLLNGFVPEACMFDRTFTSKYREKFDVVLMSQVLEHVVDLDEAVNSLNMLLGKNGIAAIAVPHFKSLVSMFHGKKDMFIIPPEHLNFFSMSCLTTLFSRHHFSLLRRETISRFPPESIRKIILISLVTRIANFALGGVLRFADSIGKGMYINCYFRKEG